LNLYRLQHRLSASLVIAGALLLFAGCQGLAGGSGGGGVGVGSSSLNFGSVVVGSSKTLTDTLSNTTSSPVTISSIQGLNSEFQVTGITLPLVLYAGQPVTFSVQFQPTDPGDPTITVSFYGQSGQAYASLSATGVGVTVGKLAPSPSSIAFGNIAVGANQTSTVTLLNSGGVDLVINQATLSGAGFSMSNLALPLTLHAGTSTSATITFAPTGVANFSGSVTFTTASNQVNSTVVLSFTGAGVAAGTLSPSASSEAFGSVQVGSNSSLSETLTNTGGVTVTISQAAASGAGFSVTGPTLPATLAANQSATFTATFAPASAGAASGTVSIVSNASNSPLSIPLTGTGLAAGALTANPSSASFGSVTIGNHQTVPVVVTNTGGESVAITSAAATGSGFSFTGPSLPITLTAGQGATFDAVFTPSAAGAASGTLTISSNASNATLSVPLSGTGVTQGTLGANPTSLAFGSVQVGNSKNLSETLTNTGGSSVTISQANLSGTGFSISGLTLPATLTTNQSVTFTATFTPASAAAASGSLSVVSNASNSTLNIALSGTGTAAGTLAVSPTSLSFGSVVDGSSSSITTSLLTASGASVTVSSASISGTNGSEFALSGISLPVTIPVGQPASFTVTFTPGATGAASASLSFTSNASNSPAVQSMTGTGTAPVQHTVDLTWNSSSGADSYNVYRKLSTDASYTTPIGSSSTTAYTDNTVVSGQTYDYVVTAVDNSGESGDSSPATAIIPNP